MEAAYINIQQVLCNPNRGLTLARLGEFGLLQYFFLQALSSALLLLSLCLSSCLGGGNRPVSALLQCHGAAPQTRTPCEV